MKLSSLALFSFLSFINKGHSHGIEVRHCIAPSPGPAVLRIFIRHWHGNLGDPSWAGSMEIQVNGIQQTLFPSGVINNVADETGLTSYCKDNLAPTLDADCNYPGYEPNWAYYDFPGADCSNSVSYSLLQGNTVVLEDGCVWYTGPMYPTTISLSQEECGCSLPSYLSKYAVITLKNASIAAPNVYTGLVIGEDLYIDNQNQIQIHSNTGYLSPADRNTFYKSLTKKSSGSRLQCNQCTILKTDTPLDEAGIIWSDLEDLARTIQPSSSGDYQVFVTNTGGDVNQAMFLGLEAQDYDLGKTLVVFNTTQDIVLKRTSYGRKWGPTILAPFSKVTLAKGNDFIDGSVIAREFVSVSGSQHLHGNAYRGDITCDESA